MHKFITNIMERSLNLDKKLLIFKTDQRKRKLETLIMKKFLTNKPGKSSEPKKEYVRCKVIRGHKKVIRNLLDNTIPKKGIAKFKLINKNQVNFYGAFHTHLLENKEILNKISLTESGPLTDGKNKIKKEERPGCANSFNNKFCQEYFSHPAVRHSFKLFFEIVFSKFKPKSLEKRFGFSCCGIDAHTLECFEKWQGLKFYLQNELFYTLDFKDEYFDESDPKSLPDISQLQEFKDFIDPYTELPKVVV